VTGERWPGEDRIATPEHRDELRSRADLPGRDSAPAEEAQGNLEIPSTDEELGPEISADEADLAPGAEEPAEAEAEPAAPEEQLDTEEDSPDTPVPDEAPPAEEDELPRLRTPEHAPGGLSIPDGYGVLAGSADGGRRAVGIVVSRFNGEVTNRLLDSALDELELAGVAREAVTIVQVPGAFELPLAAMALAKTRRFACVVALGCVIRGETPHFDYVASEAASGLQLAALETGIPVSFGVLTLASHEQAEERVGKGAEAVRSALEMADLFSQLRASATATA
jgi:6,7-dimethyl-8-ribityllumazine synthase